MQRHVHILVCIPPKLCVSSFMVSTNATLVVAKVAKAMRLEL